MIFHSKIAGKGVELYRVRTQEEVKKKIKRRLRRAREKEKASNVLEHDTELPDVDSAQINSNGKFLY